MRRKILIADADKSLHSKIKKGHFSGNPHFESVFDGSACLRKIDSYAPDLVILDLFLPRIHGIEILRKIKTDPRTSHMGVILTSSNVMLQNYYAALVHHADYFLGKPFDISTLKILYEKFFKGSLKVGPFDPPKAPIPKSFYAPKNQSSHSYIKFWGTRGSNAASGVDYVHFGGNTSCLEVRHGDHLLIIDAGIGIRPLGQTIKDDLPKHIHILFSHTHWDHMVGFPFFTPIYNPKAHISIWAPIGFEKTTKQIFTEMLAYTFFPVRLDDIQAKVDFKDMKEGEPFHIGPFEVTTCYAFHAGLTLCFKIKCGKKTFGYVTDNEFLMGYHGNPNKITKNHPLLTPYKSQIEFFKGCDLLVHEAQYTPQEYLHKVGWGHSSIANAAVLLKHANVPEWIITHHDPLHTDAILFEKVALQNEILADCKVDCRTLMASDYLTIPL